MNNIRSFLQYIAGEFSVDLWSDMAIEHAIEIASRLSVEEWEQLCADWNSHDKHVQVRIADVASELTEWNPALSQMLLEMLSSNDLCAVEASADSLNSLCQNRPAQINTQEFLEHLPNIELCDSVLAKVLGSLREKLIAANKG